MECLGKNCAILARTGLQGLQGRLEWCCILGGFFATPSRSNKTYKNGCVLKLPRGRCRDSHTKKKQQHCVHPGRLTWNLKIDLWKTILLYHPVVLRFHVNLPVHMRWSLGVAVSIRRSLHLLLFETTTIHTQQLTILHNILDG